MEIESYEKLADRVESSGSLLACEMEVLRELHEAGRLGVNVVRGISNKLAQHGLAHIPPELPTSQHEMIRIYKRGTPLARIVEAVLQPSEQGDERLREAANEETAEKLQRVRELVCD